MGDGGSDSAPQRFHGVMLSSTFADLEEHRTALIRAVEGQGLHAIGMEQDAALPDGDVVEHSLRKVGAGAAYVGVVSHRYGQVPDSPENPEELSLTQLEFREARRLGRPTLIFVMADDHPVTKGQIERDPAKEAKLDAFREEVKRAYEHSSVHRVYAEFRDLAGFATAAMQSVAVLRRHLDAIESRTEPSAPDAVLRADGIPVPPRLYAEPPYIGSHSFVGRVAQLETLDDWAGASDPHPVLLFEAIGGTGKSMLTWEWVRHRAPGVRHDRAGVFWYSFYERGAVMTDFCRRALAYMTGRPLDEFAKLKQPVLSELLLRYLRERPWLLVLDGLERVLVAYHRADAAQLADEEAGDSDQIARRDPCAAIRPQDDDLLRDLSGAAPSKILVSSRLLPRVLLNPAAQPIPGVLHERLPGLRPPDAEEMVRVCGVEGDPTVIREFLQRHCDCHPLVCGVIAGLVLHYLPARGDFDAWAADPEHGGRLDLADLDLVQKRNHILRDALAALPQSARQLLGLLALLPESADNTTLAALNPYITESIDEHHGPGRKEDAVDAPEDRSTQPEADRMLAETVHDLERRGLVQYEAGRQRYELHPVVRAVAAPRRRVGAEGGGQLDQLGQQVVDHFSSRGRGSFEDAECLADLYPGLTVVRVLQQMGRMPQALNEFRTQVSTALLHVLEGHVEALALLRPFFDADWSSVSADLTLLRDRSWVSNAAALALDQLGELEQSLAAHATSMAADLRTDNRRNVVISVLNTSTTLGKMGRLARSERLLRLGLEAAELLRDDELIFTARLDLFQKFSQGGLVEAAEEQWRRLDPMGRKWSQNAYGQGNAEIAFAEFLLERDKLSELVLIRAEELARAGRNRAGLRALHRLRGRWYDARREWVRAMESFDEAVRMARESELVDSAAEAGAALARLRAGRLERSTDEAARLATAREPAHLTLAELWSALGKPDRAVAHADAAYRRAWADGEPYVYRYALDRARTLLRRLRATVPHLSAYDSTADPSPPSDDLVEAFVARLRLERDGEHR